MFKSNFQITPKITSALMQIEACRQAIDELPIDATVLRHLRETAALMTTHFSTQIEGNRLTLPEVRAAIQGERMPGRERDERWRSSRRSKVPYPKSRSNGSTASS
jgi:Fic family protein